MRLDRAQVTILVIVLAPLLIAAGYSAVGLLGPSGTPLTAVTCTAGCSQTGTTLDINAAGGSGYATVQDEGAAQTARAILNFAGAGVTCADDTTRTTCTISGAAGSFYGTVEDEGSAVTQRPTINFIGASVTCVDNVGSNRTDCTVSGGSGGLTQPQVQAIATSVFGGF